MNTRSKIIATIAWVMAAMAALSPLITRRNVGGDPDFFLLVDMALGGIFVYFIVLLVGRVILKMLGEPSKTAPADPKPRPTHAPNSTPAPTVEADPGKLSRSEASEALRELKALHDEGILTDDEYETKRQGLADQL